MLKLLDKITVVSGYILTFSFLFLILFISARMIFIKLSIDTQYLKIILFIISLFLSIKYTKVKTPYN